MSGAGKSSLLAELAGRGRRTVDTDYDGWTLPDGSWDEPRMWRLLRGSPEVVVCGTVANQGLFSAAFDHVVLLSAPIEVLLERVAKRDGNPYGKTPEQRAEIVENLRIVEPLLRAAATVELDGRLQPAVLADAVEAMLDR